MGTFTGWRYSNNTFESNTRGSNVKMLTLSSDTYAKLKNEESNPAIAAILLIYEPAFFAYRDLCEQYSLKAGEYEGTTLGFEQYLDQMPPNLKQWEGIIRAIYNEDTPEEKQIFPNKRVPFESGTYEKRLEALGALKLKTAADPALSAANTLVTSFYNAASGARLVQQMSEGSVEQLSDLRENQRLLLANELMGVLGQLMFIHRQNLAEVERYFDLSLLTDTVEEPLQFNGNINANTILNLNDLAEEGSINPTPTSIIRMRNTSENPVTLTFYLGETPSSPPGDGPQFTLAQGQEHEVIFGEVDFGALEFFNIQNTSGMAGSWEIEIIL